MLNISLRAECSRYIAMSHLRTASWLLASTVPVRTPKCSRQSLQRWGIGFPDLIGATETEMQCGQTRFPCQRLSSKKVRADSSLGNCWKNWYRLIFPVFFNHFHGNLHLL